MSGVPNRSDVLLAALVLQGAMVVWYVPHLATDFATGASDLVARLVAVGTGLAAIRIIYYARDGSDGDSSRRPGDGPRGR
ncbi:hypothetical protein G9C85_03325 [Halorubellus sp. JP-L1]|uniref:hypothetical protein n=1 Tax=Halorubellus sp. JP-L1 TaxID=2715753 RepID=UPI001407FB66|nr:hypothetical protein [Halorubellus sp. JP-L1]NHN40668.1 hypothetical protein [Halorubellus sp. JP-L1]